MKKFNWILQRSFALLVLFFCIQDRTQGQEPAPISITGKTVDSLTTLPLGYATVQLLAAPSGKLVKEAVATENGHFSIVASPGKYFLQISFQGYHTLRTPAMTIDKDHPADLGDILLSSTATTLEEVIVQAEKSSMQFSLDKKIFNVGKDLANAGGSAIDLLTNIPSVSVDPEGSVKLRGSDNVRILIDGKPSGLVSFKGSGGLQQLQASMVERVEIITNPSARYEAEGMAGIINIVLKKEKKQGFNGSIELIAGAPINYGAAANLNYRHKKVNFFINYGISYRRTPGRNTLYQERYSPDTTFILKQNSVLKFLGLNNTIRGGLDYYFSEKSILTASYLFKRSDADRTADMRYEDYIFNTSSTPVRSSRTQQETENEPNSEYSLVYKKGFKEKGHELLAEVKFLDNWESSRQLYTQKGYFANGAEDPSKLLIQNSPNDEYEKHYLLQADYVKPIGKEGKFETGLRSSFRKMTNDYTVNELNDDGVFEPIPGFKNIFFYDENIYAAYVILGNKQKKISYQAGLRAELTDVKTTLKETNEVNPRNYLNLFPSAHLTLHLVDENALQLSYSRRVRRPFYNDLSPFSTFSDNRNFWSGNPDLDPEFSDVMELGHLKTFEKGSISSAVYYRISHGTIEFIRRVNEQGISIRLPENLLSEKSFGAEFISDYSPFKWWKLDLNLNFFHAAIDGSNILKSYKTSTYSWFARQTSRFLLSKNLDLQVRMNYEAPQKTVQGSQKSMYYADFSASKEILKGNGTLYLNVLDVFNSRKSRSVSTGPNFYARGDSQYRRRQVNLTFNYRIRQAKEVKPKKAAGEE